MIGGGTEVKERRRVPFNNCLKKGVEMLTGVNRQGTKGYLHFKVTKVSNRGTTKLSKQKKKHVGGCNAINELIPCGVGKSVNDV